MVGTRRSTAVLVANSTLGFALGVVLALLIYNVGLFAAGLIDGRSPVLFHDRVEFASGGSDVVWVGGVALTLLVGAALASIYRGGIRYDANRLAVLWVTLHCFRQGLIELVWVPFFDTSDAARALEAAEAPEPLGLVAAVLGGAGLLAIGLLAAPALFRFAVKKGDLDGQRGRVWFIALTGLVAWLIGAALAVPFFFPEVPSSTVGSLLLSGVFLLATVPAALESREISPTRDPVQFSWGLVVLLVGLVVLAQWVLVDGVALEL